jgi:hypothetical protein
MKSDLRKYMPPTQAELDELEAALSEGPIHDVPEEGFRRLMAGVDASRRLHAWRSGAQTPMSLRELVETLACAHGLSTEAISRSMPGGVRSWRQVLASKAEPWRIATHAYAALAGRFEIGLTTLKQAIMGSYRAFMQQSLRVHAQFARSSFRSRNQKDYSKQLAVAFDELRTKAAAQRAATHGEERIHRFLDELDQCMS